MNSMNNKSLARLIIVVGLVLGGAASACAGGYGRVVSPAFSKYGAPAKFYAPAPQFFFFVGAPVRIEALLEAEKRRDPAYEPLGNLRPDAPSAAVFPTGDAAASKAAGSFANVVQRCAACHSGAAAEGALWLDGSRSLSAAQITAAQRRVLRGEMPPAEPLLPPESHQVLQELLTLEATER